jgi:hypothetical protein
MKTELINEELNRVKLLMGYNTKKTLTENTMTILSEQWWKIALEDIGKVVSRDSEAALRSIEGGFRDGTMTWKNMVTTDGMTLTKTADVLEAIRLGKLGPSGTGELSKTLFLKGSSLEMRTAGAEAITSMGKFAEKYAGMSREEIVQRILRDTKYSREEAELLADTYLKKGKGKIKIEDGDPIIDGGKPEIDDDFIIWDKAKKFDWKKGLKYLAGAAGLYFLWKWLTSEKSPFPECLRKRVGTADAEKVKAMGIEALVITKTGNGDIDSAGGGIFYDDGKFNSVNNRYKGTWSEQDGGILIKIGDKDYVLDCQNIPVPPVPVPPVPTKGKCKPCSSFPMNIWCKSEKIREIQKCIGASPDSCYGPKTEAKLKEKGYSTTITQDVYNKIIKNCGQSATDDGNTNFETDVITGTDV